MMLNKWILKASVESAICCSYLWQRGLVHLPWHVSCNISGDIVSYFSSFCVYIWCNLRCLLNPYSWLLPIIWSSHTSFLLNACLPETNIFVIGFPAVASIMFWFSVRCSCLYFLCFLLLATYSLLGRFTIFATFLFLVNSYTKKELLYYKSHGSCFTLSPPGWCAIFVCCKLATIKKHMKYNLNFVSSEFLCSL